MVGPWVDCGICGACGVSGVGVSVVVFWSCLFCMCLVSCVGVLYTFSRQIAHMCMLARASMGMCDVGTGMWCLRICDIRSALFSCVSILHVSMLHVMPGFGGSEGRWMVFRWVSISCFSLRYLMSRFAMWV